MFENLSERIAGSFLMGLDAAVEFATLGEFRVVDPEVSPADVHTDAGHLTSGPFVRRPLSATPAAVDHTLLPRPATAQARASLPALVAQPVEPRPCRPAPRRRAPAPVKRPPVRKRIGAVTAPAQLCLLAD